MYKMKIKKILVKFIKIISVILISTIILILCLLVSLMCYVTYEKSQFHATQILENQKENLEFVSYMFIDTNYEIIRWDKSEINVLNFSHSYNKNDINKFNIEIDDYKLLSALNDLSENGIDSIEKQGDYVTFSMTSYLDSGYGLIYCKKYPIIEYNGETTVTYISDNWYYYTQIAD